MTYSGYYIDDNSQTEDVYAALLSTDKGDGLRLSYLPVKEVGELSADIFGDQPDLVVIDFRLDENPEMINPKQAYKGSGLAQLLRDKASVEPGSDFPIALLSAEDKFNRLYRPDSTAHDLFDEAYVKEDVAKNSERITGELIALCRGYRQIKEVWSGDRMEIFGLHGEERRIVDIQELRTAIADAAAPHVAIRVILHDVIHRSGLLLDDKEACARLGVDPAAAAKVAGALADAGVAYDGIFATGWRRWWAHRLEIWLEDMFGRRPMNMVGSERVRLLEEKLQIDLAPAKSPWNGSADEKFAFACASCGRPTEIRHSLAAFDPRVPKFGQRRRICWDCIQTDNYKHMSRLRVDDIDGNLVGEIMTKDRTGGEED